MQARVIEMFQMLLPIKIEFCVKTPLSELYIELFIEI